MVMRWHALPVVLAGLIASSSAANAWHLLITGGEYYVGSRVEKDDSVKGILIENGMITDVIRSKDLLLDLLASGVPRFSADGLTVVPGFVDPHSHYFSDSDAPFWNGKAITWREAETMLFSNGVTTVGDPEIDPASVHRLRDMYGRGQLSIRLSLYIPMVDACGVMTGWQIEGGYDTSAERLNVIGEKYFLDGGSCGRPALSFGENGGAGAVGDLWLSDEELYEHLRRSASRGAQIVLHAVGDRAVHQAAVVLKRLYQGSPPSPRPRIDHAAVVDPGDYRHIKDSGARVVGYGYYPACRPLVSAGTGRDAYLWPYGSLVAMGIPFAWHGDDPWVGPNGPLLEFQGLTTRAEANDGTDCSPPDAVSLNGLMADDALRAMTIWAAEALGREKYVGSIEVGKFADLVLLDHAIKDNGHLEGRRVMLTLLGGRPVWCALGRSCQSIETGND